MPDPIGHLRCSLGAYFADILFPPPQVNMSNAHYSMPGYETDLWGILAFVFFERSVLFNYYHKTILPRHLTIQLFQSKLFPFKSKWLIRFSYQNILIMTFRAFSSDV